MGLTRFVCCASEASDSCEEVISHVASKMTRPVIMVTGTAFSPSGHVEYTIVFRIGDKQLEVSEFPQPSTTVLAPASSCYTGLVEF